MENAIRLFIHLRKGRCVVIYIMHVKKRVKKLFPRFLRRELNNDEIEEMHALIDEVVTEAREPRSTSVDFVDRPENFLINLLSPSLKTPCGFFVI